MEMTIFLTITLQLFTPKSTIPLFPYAKPQKILASLFGLPAIPSTCKIWVVILFVSLSFRRTLTSTNDGHFAYGTLRLLDSSPTVWSFRLLDSSSNGHFV